ncbi:hypothetical protein ACFL2T_00675 [Elusimicrobiota bacterium]
MNRPTTEVSKGRREVAGKSICNWKAHREALGRVLRSRFLDIIAGAILKKGLDSWAEVTQGIFALFSRGR